MGRVGFFKSVSSLPGIHSLIDNLYFYVMHTRTLYLVQSTSIFIYYIWIYIGHIIQRNASTVV